MDPAIRAIIGIARTGYQLRAAHRNLDGCRQAIARFVAEQLARELFAFLYHVLGICQLQAGRVKRDGIGVVGSMMIFGTSGRQGTSLSSTYGVIYK